MHGQHHDLPPIGPTREGEISVEFGKNVVRLSRREWVVACTLVAGSFLLIPRLWERRELSEPVPERIPYSLSEDYWTYRRLLETTVEADRVPIIGDSFVWGEYVPPSETLSSCLGAATGLQRFANAGLNGAHPLALEGLVRDYAGCLRDRPVILHLNLLWMSAPDRDLQTDDEVAFNHPRLVPQFVPRIPAYKARFSRRVGIELDRKIAFFDLVQHVRLRDFGGRDLQAWTISNPYANPLSQIGRPMPESSRDPQRPAVSWTKQGIRAQDLPWIDLKTSLQWQAWRRTAELLRSRGNRVLAAVGPFNEHLLTERSRTRYRQLKRTAEEWLQSEGFPFVAPGLLPSEEYGDASHPLSAGYARLARQIVNASAFQRWSENR